MCVSDVDVDDDYDQLMQAAPSATGNHNQDVDDDMPLPPPARGPGRPVQPSLPSQSAADQAGIHEGTPGFQAPDADTIR